MQKLQGRVAARVSLSRRRVLVARSRGAGGFRQMGSRLDEAIARLDAARHGRKHR